MTRILLVDDSPHAQRMGERILSDEGYEVVTVSNADSALIRLEDVDPDLVLADTVMPGRTGFEICQYLKMSPRHRHVKVILTAGVLESMDEAQVKKVEADGTLRKPFEASALLSAVKPLAEAAVAARAEKEGSGADGKGRRPGGPGIAAVVPFVAVVDAEQVRAAVTVALDASMGTIVDEITSRVLTALSTKKSTTAVPPSVPSPAATPPSPPSRSAPAPAPARPEAPTPAAPPPALTLPPSRVEPVRRVSPLKVRSTSILGLELDSEPDKASTTQRFSRFVKPVPAEKQESKPPTEEPGTKPDSDPKQVD